MAELDSAAVVRRSPEVLAETVGDVVVVLDPRTDAYLKLNGSGALLWTALDEPLTVGALAGRLAGAYGLDDERALADARAFVSQLVARDVAVAS